MAAREQERKQAKEGKIRRADNYIDLGEVELLGVKIVTELSH